MRATHLADASVLVRLHHDDVVSRVGPLLVAGLVATTGTVDLELLRSARTGADHAALLAERALLPRAPVAGEVLERALAVQGLLAEAGRHRGVEPGRLVVAAAAEAAGLTVLHYDPAFDAIAAVTGQPAEWAAEPGAVP